MAINEKTFEMEIFKSTEKLSLASPLAQHNSSPRYQFGDSMEFKPLKPEFLVLHIIIQPPQEKCTYSYSGS